MLLCATPIAVWPCHHRRKSDAPRSIYPGRHPGIFQNDVACKKRFSEKYLAALSGTCNLSRSSNGSASG